MLNDALASSHFAIAGKLTGHDAIVLRGAAETPSTLLLDGDGAAPRAGPTTSPDSRPPRPRSASAPASATAWRVAAIGPAGERRVRYATISHDGRHAGRGGLGAVLGAKNLKAFAVRAATKVARRRPARPSSHAAKDLRARSFGPATAKYRELGTLANLLAFNAISTLPTRNFQAATFEGAPQLAAEELAELRTVARNNCASCTIGCEHIYRGANGGRHARSSTRTSSRSARMCGVSDPDAVLAASAPLRRPRPRHDLGGRHDRLGDGVRRARPARRALAALR